ncbi:MAG TPA: chromosomal replication initiator protein DnaA [Gemmatimonadaceae bacterium]|nr:chromosomal replication initiator protein DnaA [Gemmatimonadaceae bacterium]
MSLSHSEVWKLLLDRARQELPDQTFQAWLEPTEALSMEGNTLFAGAPDQFTADWNNSKHAELVSSYAPIVLGHPLNVVFRVHEERKKRSQMDFFVAPPPNPVKPAFARSNNTSTPLSDRYTFDLFVIGKSNDVAAAAAHAVSQAPGKVYNPLFIYGDTGLGKTHLMQAIAHETLQRSPETRITYVGAEQFMNELIGAILDRTGAEFRRRYRETDLLLIDDVHFLKGRKESTQEEFFHTFNALYEAGRQIVLTSDRPPSEIAGLEARLISRFQWGMVADIALPDFEHRVAILKQKAKLDRLELTIPDDVIYFIAEHVRSNVRELEGAIIKLLAYASLKHKDITVEVAREALRDKLRASEALDQEKDTTLTLLAIQQAVAKEWGVTVEGLRSKTRTKLLTTPRQIAMYLTRELLSTQLVEIGNGFGGRDHSTVIHSLEKVQEAVSQDSELKNRIQKIRTALQNLTPVHT